MKCYEMEEIKRIKLKKEKGKKKKIIFFNFF